MTWDDHHPLSRRWAIVPDAHRRQDEERIVITIAIVQLAAAVALIGRMA